VIQARRDGAASEAQDLLDLMLNSAHPVTGRSLDPVNIRTGQRACIGRQFALHESVLTLALILHRYDLTAENDYQLKIFESITLKPRGFRLGLSKRAASSRLAVVDTELTRLSA
jgi:cytochrome P450